MCGEEIKAGGGHRDDYDYDQFKSYGQYSEPKIFVLLRRCDSMNIEVDMD